MPQPELLETFPNPYPGRSYQIHMSTDEFTSLCPVGGIETDAAELAQLRGGAPDFATIEITYVPAELCLELKALKLYLWSFRNDGEVDAHRGRLPRARRDQVGHHGRGGGEAGR